MLKLNLNQLNQIVTVSSLDDEFKNTNLENTGFEIDVKNLSRSDKSKLLIGLQENNSNPTIADYRKMLLLTSIVDIRGVEIKDGENVISDKIEQLNAFYELVPDLIIDTLVSVIDGFTKAEEEKKSDTEITAPTSQNGM